MLVKRDGKWLSLSHTADFAKPINQQSSWDWLWNQRHMIEAPSTFRDSIAAQKGVPQRDVQVFIGHISDILFGKQANFIDLDDSKVNVSSEQFDALPVKIYCLETGQFYQ